MRKTGRVERELAACRTLGIEASATTAEQILSVVQRLYRDIAQKDGEIAPSSGFCSRFIPSQSAC